MSLVGTLAKVAIGAMVAKGVGGMVKGKMGQGGGAGGGLGGLLGGGSGGGGLGGLLGGQSGQGSGLGGLLGGGQQANAGGGAAGGLGGLLGGQGGAGGLGGLLESLGGAGGQTGAGQAPAGGSLGDLLNSALGGGQPPAPTPSQEDQAKLLIKAMISAAKSDGTIDQEEQQKIVSHLGDDISEEERQFVIAEMQAPLDMDGLLRDTSEGMQQQVYMMSIMGINLDSKAEAEYLDGLRQRLGIDEQACNAIHQQLGVPVLYG